MRHQWRDGGPEVPVISRHISNCAGIYGVEMLVSFHHMHLTTPNTIFRMHYSEQVRLDRLGLLFLADPAI